MPLPKLNIRDPKRLQLVPLPPLRPSFITSSSVTTQTGLSDYEGLTRKVPGLTPEQINQELKRTRGEMDLTDARKASAYEAARTAGIGERLASVGPVGTAYTGTSTPGPTGMSTPKAGRRRRKTRSTRARKTRRSRRGTRRSRR